jgi:hypothetical protein
VLSVSFGPIGAVIGAGVLCAAGWARVTAGDDSFPQVVAGIAVGAAVSAAVYVPLHQEAATRRLPI